ncbi:MAG: hypothetical protein KGM44_05245, partial [bacterium]|nr:hypothetical protein [bacterium]
TVFGALEELAPALAQAGLLLERPEPVEAPALRAARLGAVATPPFEGVHGVQPDYGERPHTTVAQ